MVDLSHRSLAEAGRLAEAEAQVLAAIADACPFAEAHPLQLADLMTIYSRECRHCETLAVARLLVERKDEIDPALRLHALRMTGTQWCAIGDARRAQGIAEQVRSLLGGMSASFSVRFCAVEMQFQIAQLVGDHSRSRECVRELTELLRGFEGPELGSIAIPKYEAEAYLLGGNHSLAVQVYDREEVRHAVLDTVPAKFGLALDEAEVCLRAGCEEQALRALERVVPLLVDQEREGAPPGLLLDHGLAIYDMCFAIGADALAKEAEHVALSVLPARVVELDHAASVLPISDLLRTVQQNFSRTQRRKFFAQAATKRLLASALAGDGPDILHEPDVIMRCAWCSRVKTVVGNWLPIGHWIDPKSIPTGVTHGMCPECQADFP